MDVRVAISMGDPVGIGPEIVLKALTSLPAAAHAQVYGCRSIFERLGRQLNVRPPQRVEWIDVAQQDVAALRPGQTSTLAGRVQVTALERAVDAVLTGRADVLCTAPITKEAAGRAGFRFPGHTEYLAHRTGAPRHAMMLAGPVLRVVPVTGHLALREVPGRLSQSMFTDALELTVRAVHYDFGVELPHVAVAGLNPHAGEGGLLGHEEQQLIMPAIDTARRCLDDAGIAARIAGPLSADALFAHLADQPYDAVVCGYHDQALVPFKMLHRDDGVNVTLGLPFVRTSPAHGSALDIAGRGVARPTSMIAALVMAVELHRRRQAAGHSPAVLRS